jgi:hypothetical protein
VTLLQGTSIFSQQSWPVTAVHDTVAIIARQDIYERTVGQSAWTQFWNAVGRAIHAIYNFFRGSQTGRNVTIAIVVLIVLAVAIHFVLSALAARSDVVAADASRTGTRATDAWRDAERLAAEGRFTDASHALLAAMLSAFAQRGEVRLHASKTAGDYARELARRGSPAGGAFQQFRRRYDALIFGVGTCTADEYAALLRDAAPILSRAGIA